MPAALKSRVGAAIALSATATALAGVLSGTAAAGGATITIGSFDQTDDWSAPVSLANQRLAGSSLDLRLGPELFLQVLAGASRTPAGPQGAQQPSVVQDAEQYLLRSTLGFTWKAGGWRFTPSASLTYFSDREYSAYDASGPMTAMATLTRLQAGPELAYQLKVSPDIRLEPFVSVNYLYDVQLTLTDPVLATDFSSSDARLRLSGGMGAEIGALSVRGTAFYEGQGAGIPNFGAELVARIPLE